MDRATGKFGYADVLKAIYDARHDPDAVAAAVLTAALLPDEWKPFPERCQYCNRMTICGNPSMRNSPYLFSRQHILPQRRGGNSHRHNLKTACRECNATLNIMDDCPGALACMLALGELFHYGRSNRAAVNAARKIGLVGSHYDPATWGGM